MNTRIQNGTEILGYEPAFGMDVITAFINHEARTIRPAHGYFAPHRYGKENTKYAKEIGYKFINK
jgi:hypothetical protein